VQVEDHVLAQPRPDQPGQPHDEVVVETRLHEFLQQAAVQPVGMQPGLLDRCFFIDAVCLREDVDGAHQDEAPALHVVDVGDEGFDGRAIGFGFPVGDPLLCRCRRANHGAEFAAVYIGDVGGTELRRERCLLFQQRADEAAVPEQRVGWRRGVRRVGFLHVNASLSRCASASWMLSILPPSMEYAPGSSACFSTRIGRPSSPSLRTSTVFTS
jgi:hypothetical protein